MTPELKSRPARPAPPGPSFGAVTPVFGALSWYEHAVSTEGYNHEFPKQRVLSAQPDGTGFTPLPWT